MRLDHVHVVCNDRQAMAAWLTEVFGLTPAQEFTAWANGGPLFLRSETGENALALFQADERHVFSVAGDHTVAFAVAPARFLELFRACSARDLPSPQGRPLADVGVTDHELAMSFYILSPEHHRLEVTCYDVAAVKEGLAEA